MTASAKNVMNGTYGTLWVNGDLWAEVDTFEAKVAIKYDDVHFSNDPATHKKATGWDGSGSMTIKKIYSRVQNAMANAVRAGNFPRFEMVGKLADGDALGTQRVSLHDVTLDEFDLLKFEQKKLETEQIAFKFSDYELIDSVPNPN